MSVYDTSHIILPKSQRPHKFSDMEPGSILTTGVYWQFIFDNVPGQARPALAGPDPEDMTMIRQLGLPFVVSNGDKHEMFHVWDYIPNAWPLHQNNPNPPRLFMALAEKKIRPRFFMQHPKGHFVEAFERKVTVKGFRRSNLSNKRHLMFINSADPECPDIDQVYHCGDLGFEQTHGDTNRMMFFRRNRLLNWWEVRLANE